MIKMFTRLLAALLIAALTPVVADAAMPPWASVPATATPPGYTLAFDDEFDGPLDLACFTWKAAGLHNWYMYEMPSTPANGIANAVGCKQANVANGVLTLTLSKVNGVWTSPHLMMVDPMGEGRAYVRGIFSARIKLPVAPVGFDLWPAWWTLSRWTQPTLKTYPMSEVDILESWSSSNPNGATTAYQHPANPPTPDFPIDTRTSIPGTLNVFDGLWHTWTERVTDDTTCVDVDGAQRGCIPTSSLPPGPIWGQLVLDVKTIAATVDPTTVYPMQVDWVRVYTPTPPAPNPLQATVDALTAQVASVTAQLSAATAQGQASASQATDLTAQLATAQAALLTAQAALSTATGKIATAQAALN